MIGSTPRALSVPALPLTVLATATLAAATLLGPASPSLAATAPPTADAADAGRTPAPVINEVETNGDDVDWVELGNPGTGRLDVSGYVLTDSEPEKHRYTLPTGTTIPAGGLITVTQKERAADGFDFGLGSDDAVHLYAPDTDAGTQDDPVASYSWSAHAKVTWGRCPDLTGDFTQTFASTPGKPNTCEDPGPSTPAGKPWPGGQSVRALDTEDEDRGDVSGIDVEPGTGDPSLPDGGHGRLWAVQNGDGELYRLDTQDRGATWDRSATWRLRYPDGSGTVDAEGVTVTTDASRGIYVSSERDNDRDDVSRPSVLRYDVGRGSTTRSETGRAGTELRAAQEWNLAEDFPGLGANSGLEGVTWIPDSWLTRHGFQDQHTHADYDPAAYPGHGDGLFVVGVEGTGKVYLYALLNDGGFQRVATVDPGFDVVADVQFDAERDELWVVCDDACDGQIATFALSQGSFEHTATYRRPAETQNYANEGFAIAPLASCARGRVATYYVDDNNTDGHSLRTGSLDTTCPTPPEPSPTPSPSSSPTSPVPPVSDAPSTPGAGAVAVGHGGGTPPRGEPVAGGDAAPSGMGNNREERSVDAAPRTEPMARTGLEATTLLIGAGSVLLIVAGLVMFRAARKH